MRVFPCMQPLIQLAALLGALSVLTTAVHSAETAIPVQGTLALVIPHGTETVIGKGHRVGLAVIQDGVLTDQAVVTPTVQWDDSLHGLKVEIPPTSLRLTPSAKLGVTWAVGVTGNGKGPWQGGQLMDVKLVARGGTGVFSTKPYPIRLEQAQPERPSVLLMVPIAPKRQELSLSDGAVTCLVLAAPASKSPPGLLVTLGMGPGDEESCRAGLARWWAGAPRAGWTVVAPVTRPNTLWDAATPATISALLDELIKRYRCDPARIVIAGPSNGGTGALAWLSAHPERIRAVLAFPGSYPTPPADVRGIPVWLRWGAGDSRDWRTAAAKTAAAFTAAGARVDSRELADEEHIPEVTGAEMLAWLDAVLR